MAKGSGADPSPEQIRADLEATRADLGRKVTALKHLVLGTDPPTRKGARRTMATKKASKQSPASRGSARRTTSKASATKKTSAGRGGKSGGGKKTSHKSSSVLGRKAKKVVGEMLAGAALGAVTGAAKAVLPATGKGGKKQKAGDEE